MLAPTARRTGHALPPATQRARLITRLHAAGELALHDEGLALLDAPMTPWLAFEADALSALAAAERGAA